MHMHPARPRLRPASDGGDGMAEPHLGSQRVDLGVRQLGEVAQLFGRNVADSPFRRVCGPLTGVFHALRVENLHPSIRVTVSRKRSDATGLRLKPVDSISFAPLHGHGTRRCRSLLVVPKADGDAFTSTRCMSPAEGQSGGIVAFTSRQTIIRAAEHSCEALTGRRGSLGRSQPHRRQTPSPR